MSKNKASSNDLSFPPSNEESMGDNNTYAGGSASVHPRPKKAVKSNSGKQSLGPAIPVGHSPVGSVAPAQQGPSSSSSGFSAQPPVTMVAMPATTKTRRSGNTRGISIQPPTPMTVTDDGGSASVRPRSEKAVKSNSGKQSLGPVIPVGHSPVGSVAPAQQGPRSTSGFSAQPPVTMITMPAITRSKGSGNTRDISIQPPIPMTVTETKSSGDTRGINVQPPAPMSLRVRESLGPGPVSMKCPACQKWITTTTKTAYTRKAHIICAILCVFCLCLFAWIPYVVSTYKVTKHKCPECEASVGTFEQSQRQ